MEVSHEINMSITLEESKVMIKVLEDAVLTNDSYSIYSQSEIDKITKILQNFEVYL